MLPRSASVSNISSGVHMHLLCTIKQQVLLGINTNLIYIEYSQSQVWLLVTYPHQQLSTSFKMPQNSQEQEARLGRTVVKAKKKDQLSEDLHPSIHLPHPSQNRTKKKKHKISLRSVFLKLTLTCTLTKTHYLGMRGRLEKNLGEALPW